MRSSVRNIVGDSNISCPLIPVRTCAYHTKRNAVFGGVFWKFCVRSNWMIPLSKLAAKGPELKKVKRVFYRCSHQHIRTRLDRNGDIFNGTDVHENYSKVIMDFHKFQIMSRQWQSVSNKFRIKRELSSRKNVVLPTGRVGNYTGLILE